MTERKRGFVKFFLSIEGYGYISHDDGSPDIFFHVTSVRNPELLDRYAICEYMPGTNRQGPKALDVEVSKEKRF